MQTTSRAPAPVRSVPAAADADSEPASDAIPAPTPALPALATPDPDGPPAGSIQGGPATILKAMVRARAGLVPAQRLILEALLYRCYQYAPPPEQWAELRGEREWLGWARVSQVELAEEVVMSTGTLSGLLSEMERLGILKRGEGAAFAYITIAHPACWAQEIFDRDRVKAAHARPGAGRPKMERRRDPATPIEERGSTDAFGKPYLTEDELRAAMADHEAATEDVLTQMWRFAQHFQTVCDDRFDISFLDGLLWALTERRWTVSLLNAQLHQQMRNKQITHHWGYLLTTIERGPHVSLQPKAEDHHAEDQSLRPSPRQQPRRSTSAPAAPGTRRFGGSPGRQPRQRDDDGRASVASAALGG